MAKRDLLARTAGYIESLETALTRSRREHDHCDDSWYCCGACRHPDHLLAEGEHLESHSGEASRVGGKCNCGADDYNRLIDNILADGEMDAAKRSYR